VNDYFFGAGVAGPEFAGPGVAGADLAGDDLIPCRTEFELMPRRDAITDRVMEVSMKMMVDHVVARERAVAAPRGPKAVWLPWPPNAATMSPLFPLCSKTTMIKKKQTAM
jgi:hypothetical protein